MAPKYYVGTSGFSYPHWRGIFYPAKLPQSRWLEYYATEFSTVELNNSFYRLPSERAFQGWRTRTPEGFIFAVKASRFITHLRRLRQVQAPLETFLSRARHLNEKLGPILYQLPPNMPRDKDLLEGFLSILPQGLQHVLEFRNQSWYEEGVHRLLRQHNVAFCVHDMSKLESPVLTTADFAYFRFHGPTGRYAGRYTDEMLQEWAQRIRQVSPDLKVIYVYFNNDVAGYAVKNAMTLGQLLS